MNPRVVQQAASIALSYPTANIVAWGPRLRQAMAEQKVGQFDALLDTWQRAPLEAAQRHYIDVFDLTRKRTLYLSFYVAGDTRRRGAALTGFKQRYRASGYLVDTHGELPDFLPLVLEYAALADPSDGQRLLQENRRGLELLRLALAEHHTPYLGLLEAVCATLPGPSPEDVRAVMAMAASGPPVEHVGLEPGDPRLLPLRGR